MWERFDSVTRELWGVARHIPKAVYDWCLGRCICGCLRVFGDTKRERGFGYEAFLVLDDLPSSFSGYRVFKQSRSVSAFTVTQFAPSPPRSLFFSSPMATFRRVITSFPSSSSSYPYSNTAAQPAPSLSGTDYPHDHQSSPTSPTMRKRQRTLDQANPADPAQGHQQQTQPVTDDAFIADNDAVDSNAEDDDDDGEKPKSDKKAGRRKIKIEFIQDKSRRHITFSKRKAGTSVQFLVIHVAEIASRNHEKGVFIVVFIVSATDDVFDRLTNYQLSLGHKYCCLSFQRQVSCTRLRPQSYSLWLLSQRARTLFRPASMLHRAHSLPPCRSAHHSVARNQ